MSNTHPAHLPLVPGQIDPYFVGTLHLTSCLPEKVSVSPPPPYEVLTLSSTEDLKLAFPSVIKRSTSPKPVTKWGELLIVCEKSSADLQTLSENLKRSRLKQHLLKEEKEQVEQAIEAGLAKVKAVSLATQAICKEDTPVNLNALKNALTDLKAMRPSVSSSKPSSEVPLHTEPTSWWMKRIKDYLGPLALMGWGLIAQSGMLSSETAKTIPLVGGAVGFLLKIKENFETFIQEAKTEDIDKLIETRDAIVELFMNVHNIDTLFQGRALVEQNRVLVNDTRKKLEKLDLLELVDSNIEKLLDKDQSARIERLEGRLTNIEQGIALLLKQSNIQHSTNQKTVDNAA